MPFEKKPVFSICIPTYGRPHEVERLLSLFSGMAQKPGLKGKFELCISDNNEGIGTKKIVDSYRGKVRMQYHRWGKNVGYDRNAFKAMELAKGEYFQLLSDEAGYDSGKLQEAVNLLESRSPDGLAIRCPMENPTPSSLLSYMTSLRGVASYYGSYSGTFIMRKKFLTGFLRAHKGGISGYSGKGFIHIPLFLHFLKNAESIGKLDAVVDRGRQTVFFPSTLAKLYLNFYYALYMLSRENGVISAQEFSRFKSNYFLALPFLMFKIRIYMRPGTYEKEIAAVRKETEWLPGEYRGLKGAIASFWLAFFFNRLIPFHWFYGIWYFYKKRVKKDPQALDMFENYDKREKEREEPKL